MEIRIKLSQNIYDQLQEEAKQRGLKVNELVKWIIGDYIKYLNPPTRLMALPSIPLSVQPTIDKISTTANLIVNQFSSQGILKCPNCTLPLSSEALETGECNNCGTKL